ncbi:hypothetical protein [Vibrio hepatarius]|uniref:hypothetical protein n=1 Tax=Vibrio hepatarius TaxID=171383 RepID=UPI001C08CD3A|nr:hypothetical protein [Vibrio hepatarius]MBU2895668.1 hypothetical protein [Vibrio hepatarius]
MRRVTPVSKRVAQVRPPKIFKTPSASRLRKFIFRMDRFKEKLFIDVFDLEGSRLSEDEFFFKFDDIFDAAMSINDVKIARDTREKVDG